MRYYEIVRATFEEAEARRPKKPLVPAQSSNRKTGYPTATAAVDIFWPVAEAEDVVDQPRSSGMRVKNGL
ncbi:hypothetical protein [Methylorubrum extorquens]|uniref:Uncharacterized protein n=1 Tax=Methylorubrum extorquens (strain CM4 / NCIMB 13688) TaxID=440085 RepID=B7KRL4_METC4|nr:hypothetical protein [Methylorubrum extorquens]ACK85541.1 hypothetical protein Mchl_4767 [Methylorubrum extorquens CM4]